MPTNPFTSESRDHIVSVNLPDVCTRLRCPSSLRIMFDELKPKHVSIPDIILKDRLAGIIMPLVCDGDWGRVQDTLDTIFGPRTHRAEVATTGVVSSNGRSR